MRVCLLTDEKIEDFNPAIHFQHFEWDHVTVQPPIDKFLQRLTQGKNYDVYLNIYEGIDEAENSGARFVALLEDHKLPFTGADSRFYNVTREEMQSAAVECGLHFARGFHAEKPEDLAQVHDLQFPLIVKHPNSFASSGLTKDSRVENFDEVAFQFQRVHSLYGSARIEEFIEGREASCLVVENTDNPASPFVYPPALVQFPDGETFLHEDAKWYNWDVFVVKLDDDVLAAQIQDVARKYFIAINGNGYARIDFRVRLNGEIVILEINPNCGILYYGPDDRSHADLAISWGGGHQLFLNRIFKAAISRNNHRADK